MSAEKQRALLRDWLVIAARESGLTADGAAGLLDEYDALRDAETLRAAIAAVEDPDRRRGRTGLGLGWESARDVLSGLLDSAEAALARWRNTHPDATT